MESSGQQPVAHRRVVFATLSHCNDRSVIQSDGDKGVRLPMVSNTSPVAVDDMARCFDDPANPDPISCQLKASGIRVLEDKTVYYTGSGGDGYVKTARFYNKIEGRTSYMQSNGVGVTSFAAGDSKLHNVYMMDIWRCGFSGLTTSDDVKGSFREGVLCDDSIGVDTVRIKSVLKLYWSCGAV